MRFTTALAPKEAVGHQFSAEKTGRRRRRVNERVRRMAATVEDEAGTAGK